MRQSRQAVDRKSLHFVVIPILVHPVPYSNGKGKGRDRCSPQNHIGSFEFSALWQLAHRLLVSVYTDWAA
jgi:hypothetical protein